MTPECLREVDRRFRENNSRGPETTSFTCVEETNLYFGFHRLAINGLDISSDQPLVRSFGDMRMTLICNGEIYNSLDIHKEWGDKAVSQSDCESIMTAYANCGTCSIASLDGVFAFVLYVENDKWANGKNTMTMARDPFGVRPLYAFKGKHGFGVMSDLNTLECRDGQNDVSEFPPGTWAQYEIRKDVAHYMNERVFYTPYGIVPHSGLLGTSTLYERIRETLIRAVRKRVVGTCERPIACLLSGGLDSSLICSIVVRVLSSEVKGFDPRSIRTFSIGFGDDPTDFAYAREVAEFLGTTHTEIRTSFQDALNAIPEVVRAIGSCDVTTVRASVGNYLVARAIRETCDAKVILNGDGADEVMGGYLYFGAAPSQTAFDLECKRLLKDIHMFDVLRSDRSISMNGLEARTPYLDREFVEMYLSIPCSMRAWNLNLGQCEKWLVRRAFSATEDYHTQWLPESVLWRKKEAFSDGVSSLERSWFEVVDEHVRAKGYDGEKEYYRTLMEEAVGKTELTPYMWMPRWCEAKDASARTLGELYSRDK
jgi:asparagine synthase (glutamine-hydrolysing)